MRVGLIVPPSAFLLDERVFPSLGITRVAAVLERDHVPVRVLDLSGSPAPLQDTRSFLNMWQPTHVGLTVTTPQYPAAVQIQTVLREWNIRMPLILGGPHVTMTHAAARSPGHRAERSLRDMQSRFDVLVAGDGERAIHTALNMQGTGYLVDADNVQSAYFLKDEDLNRLPFPARHLLDMGSYRYRMPGASVDVKSTSLIAQLGCPFGCTFCGGRNTASFRTVRRRSTNHVLAEVIHLYRDYGYTGFMFQDDELNVNSELISFLKQLTDVQENLGVRFACRGFIKAQLLTEEQARWLVTAGFTEVLIGFEAADDRILLAINKRSTLAQNTRALAIARQAGLRVKALMSIGHAGETAESVCAIRQWLVHEAPEEFDVTVITPYPGTPYYDAAVPTDLGWTYTCPKTQGRLHMIDVDFAEEAAYYKGIPGEYVSHVWTDALSRDDLVKLRDALEADVRSTLNIPWPTGNPAVSQYEHSMGAR